MIVAGFGFRAGAGPASLSAALDAAQRGHPPVTALAVPGDKGEPVERLAATLGLPVIAVPPMAIHAMPTVTNSPASLRHRGTGSVAEAAALAGAGHGARLIAIRDISPDRMATCAIAEGPDQ